MDQQLQEELQPVSFAPVVVVQDWFVGDADDFITFDSKILLDGRVELFSVLYSTRLRKQETFLYEVAERYDALDCACCMVLDAEEFLADLTGHDADEGLGEDFIDYLEQELGAGLH